MIWTPEDIKELIEASIPYMLSIPEVVRNPRGASLQVNRLLQFVRAVLEGYDGKLAPVDGSSFLGLVAHASDNTDPDDPDEQMLMIVWYGKLDGGPCKGFGQGGSPMKVLRWWPLPDTEELSTRLSTSSTFEVTALHGYGACSASCACCRVEALDAVLELAVIARVQSLEAIERGMLMDTTAEIQGWDALSTELMEEAAPLMALVRNGPAIATIRRCVRCRRVLPGSEVACVWCF